MAAEGSRLRPERPGDRLDSWKEIADYLDREPRTVQRWERIKGLPVRRLAPDSPEEQPRVFAYKSEIDAWWHERETKIKEEPDDSDTEREETKPDPVAMALRIEGKGVENIGQRHRLQRLLYPGVPSVLVVAIVAVVIWHNTHPPFLSQPKVILAVMPFQNSSGGPEAQRIARGLTDEMISRLGHLHPDQLMVIELTPSESALPLAQIRKNFGADFVLEGAVRAGERVAITARLTSAKEQPHVIWGDRWEFSSKDIIDDEIRVAAGITDQLLSVLPHDSHSTHHVSRETYEAYLTGRALWNRRTAESLNSAISYFEKATQSDPMYAPAYAGLADCYSLLGSAPYTALRPKEAFPKAKEAAQQALKIDNTLAEAHLSLGYAQLVYDWNYTEAEKEFKRAVELRPSSATVHQYYGYYLTVMGKLDEAIIERKKAQELQPDSPLINSALGEAYYEARQFDNTIAQNQKSLVLDPSYAIALINLGRAYEQKGMYQQALTAFQTILAVTPNDPVLLALIGHTYAVSGDRSQARAILGQLQQLGATRYVPSLYIALVYTGLGQRNEAFQWLDKAYSERCEYLVYMSTEPLADPLRGDPRFAKLLKRLHLSPPGVLHDTKPTFHG